MPIRRRSDNQIHLVLSMSAQTRVTMAPTVRQAIRISRRTRRISSPAPPARPPGHRNSVGMPGTVARPGHRGHRRPVFGAAHPRRLGLEHHLHGAPIQAPPPARTLTPVIPRPPTATTAAAARNPTSWPHPRQHPAGRCQPGPRRTPRTRCPRSPCACRHPTAHEITSHCARRCPLPWFLTLDKPETLSDNDVRPTHPENPPTEMSQEP